MTNQKLHASLLAVTLLAGCSGRNIYPDAHEDSRILMREWTRSTHLPTEAGERSSEYSNPLIVDNTLIYGTRNFGLTALYPKLAQKRWELPIKNGIISEITHSKDLIYFVGGDGLIYAVKLENGKVEWTYEIRNAMTSRPTIAEGRLLITTTDDTVYSLDSATGKWLWHYKRRTSPTSTILGAAQPVVDNNEVLTGFSDGSFVALSLDDGSLKWEKQLHMGTRFTDVDAKPIIDQGIVYASAYDGSLYALKRAGGAVIWKTDMGGVRQVVLDDDRMYVPASDGYVYAIQKSTSKSIWKFRLDRGTPTDLVMTDHYLIFGSSYQYLYVVDKGTGNLIYRFNVGYASGFSGAPAFDTTSRMLYLISGMGNLYAFKLAK